MMMMMVMMVIQVVMMVMIVMMVCIVEDGACTLMSTLSYWSLNKNVPSLYGVWFHFRSNIHTRAHSHDTVHLLSNGSECRCCPRVATDSHYSSCVPHCSVRSLKDILKPFCLLCFQECALINHYTTEIINILTYCIFTANEYCYDLTGCLKFLRQHAGLWCNSAILWTTPETPTLCSLPVKFTAGIYISYSL